jgi:hypothetical protein
MREHVSHAHLVYNMSKSQVTPTRRVLLYATMLTLIALSSWPTGASAQSCPTTFLPSGCSWNPGNGVAPVPIPGTTCIVQASYCYTCCNGVNYFYIYSIVPQTLSDCNGVDPQDMLNAVSHFLFLHTAMYGCIDPCPNGSVNVQVQTASCWQKNLIPGGYELDACPSTCTCKATANVSCSGAISGCTTETVGTCSCATDPGSVNSWVTGVCYQLTCPGC